MAGLLQITTARIPSADSPTCGVTLEPYVVVRRGDQNIDAKDCAEEGSGDARFSLRFRWYRSTVNKGGAVCFFHQVTKHLQTVLTLLQHVIRRVCSTMDGCMCLSVHAYISTSPVKG